MGDNRPQIRRVRGADPVGSGQLWEVGQAVRHRRVLACLGQRAPQDPGRERADRRPTRVAQFTGALTLDQGVGLRRLKSGDQPLEHDRTLVDRQPPGQADLLVCEPLHLDRRC